MQATEQTAERFVLAGDLDDPALCPWIMRHAARLGLGARITSYTVAEVSLEVEGSPDLLDAMEAGCLLGPIGSWIESIRREPTNRPG